MICFKRFKEDKRDEGVDVVYFQVLSYIFSW